MKLLSFLSPSRANFGLVEGDRVIGLGPRLGSECPDLRTALQIGAFDRIRHLAAGATQVWMKDGDVVEIELEGAGVLRNPVRKESTSQ